MIYLIDWLKNRPGYNFVPLFDTDNSLIVRTKLTGAAQRRILRRSPNMENAIISIVEKGLDEDHWEGLFYIMGKGSMPDFELMYIGKTEKKGVKNPINENIKNIRKNQHMFARWGNGLDYHIGDLSHTLFGFKAYRKPTKKYAKWAKALFDTYDPPMLKEPISIYLSSWYEGDTGPSGMICSLPAVEKEIIALASVQFKDILLNIDGR